MQTLKKLFSEFLGTLLLVLFACGTAAVLGCSTTEVNVAYLLTAFAFGLVLLALVAVFGGISGCHVNPAVSFAMLLTGRMKFADFCGYVLAQFAGAIAGTAILSALIGTESGFGQNGLYHESIGLSILIEAILTFVFVLTVLAVSKKAKSELCAAGPIGLTLALVHIFGIHFTGTSVNPARSLGPAIFAGGKALSDVWVFLVAPLVGALVAALVYRLLFAEKEAIAAKTDGETEKAE